MNPLETALRQIWGSHASTRRIKATLELLDTPGAGEKANNACQLVAWEYARGVRKPSGTCSVADDILRDIIDLCEQEIISDQPLPSPPD